MELFSIGTGGYLFSAMPHTDLQEMPSVPQRWGPELLRQKILFDQPCINGAYCVPDKVEVIYKYHLVCL